VLMLPSNSALTYVRRAIKFIEQMCLLKLILVWSSHVHTTLTAVIDKIVGASIHQTSSKNCFCRMNNWLMLAMSRLSISSIVRQNTMSRWPVPFSVTQVGKYVRILNCGSTSPGALTRLHGPQPHHDEAGSYYPQRLHWSALIPGCPSLAK